MSEKDNRYKVLTDIDISRHNLLNVQKIEGSEHDNLGKTLEITTPPSSTVSTGSIVIHPGVFTSYSSSETGRDSEVEDSGTVDTSKSGSLYLYAGENSPEIEDGNLSGTDENPNGPSGITLFPDSNISIISKEGSIIEKSKKNLRLLAGDPTADLNADDFQESNLKNHALLDLSSSESICASLGVSKETERTSDLDFSPAPQKASIRLFCSEDSENLADTAETAASLEVNTSGVYINQSNRLKVSSSFLTNDSAKSIANSWRIGKDSLLENFKEMLKTYFSPSSVQIGCNSEDTSSYAYDLKVELEEKGDSEVDAQWNPSNKEYEWISTEHIDNLNVHRNLEFDGSKLTFKSSNTISIDAPAIKIGVDENKNYKNTNLQIHSNSLKIDSDKETSSIEVNKISVNKTSTIKGEITLGDEKAGITINAPKSINLTSSEYSIGFANDDPILSGDTKNLILNVDTAEISTDLTSKISTSLEGSTTIEGELDVSGTETSIASKTINIGNTSNTKAITVGNESANLVETSNTLTSTSEKATEKVTKEKSSNIKSYDLTIEELRVGKITKDKDTDTETFEPVGDFKVEVNKTSSSVQSTAVKATNYVEAPNLYVNKLSIYWDDDSNSVVFAKRA